MQQFPEFSPGNKCGWWDNDRAFIGCIYQASGKTMIWQTKERAWVAGFRKCCQKWTWTQHTHMHRDCGCRHSLPHTQKKVHKVSKTQITWQRAICTTLHQMLLTYPLQFQFHIGYRQCVPAYINTFKRLSHTLVMKSNCLELAQAGKCTCSKLISQCLGQLIQTSCAVLQSGGSPRKAAHSPSCWNQADDKLGSNKGSHSVSLKSI